MDSRKGSAKVVPVVNVAPVADKVAAWVKVAEAAYDAQPGFTPREARHDGRVVVELAADDRL